MGHGSPIGQSGVTYETPNVDWLLEGKGAFRKTVVLEEGSVDSGGDRTTLLRSGLVLGKITATGDDQSKYAPCDLSKSDGREAAMGILLFPVDMLDEENNTGDRKGVMLFGPAYVDASKGYVYDSGGTQQTLDGEATPLTALRGDGMVFKGDA